MNIKYFYEFAGLDGIFNRVEILCNKIVVAKEITATGEPFILEYAKNKKLAPVNSSGATLGLISKSVFQFMDLHTDNMQEYLVKFYRSGVLYWMGWLDSELYTEDLSAVPPYAVEFTASDFNISERLKYKDASENNYTDVASLITHVKRCFDKIGIPFGKLYIGCTTIPDGITLSESETVLHATYMQSANFYDEDNEAMSCRGVVESILEPFALMVVQRDANLYIYDYNTVAGSGVFKCYNLSNLNYVGDTAVNVNFGDFKNIGFASNKSSLEFEEMINNTEITSSMYISSKTAEANVDTKYLFKELSRVQIAGGEKITYKECKEWDGSKFILFDNGSPKSSISGADGMVSTYRFQLSKDYVIGSTKKTFLKIDMRTYVNVRDSPLPNIYGEDNTEKIDKEEFAIIMETRGKLYITNPNGIPIKYFKDYGGHGDYGWHDITDGVVPTNMFSLWFSTGEIKSQITILNKWVDLKDSCGNYRDNMAFQMRGDLKESGRKIKLEEGIFGYLILEIMPLYKLFNPGIFNDEKSSRGFYPLDRIKDVLYNDFKVSLVDSEGDRIPTDDYEFKSYINKKVKSDFEKKELKVVSCNEEFIPVGKGNILKKKENHYELQLKFTRFGQTDILERLLMCTIHSNFATKNRIISVDLNTVNNPVMQYVTYNDIIESDGMFVEGCKLDFKNSITKITASDYSADTAKLSDIPYE